jgi:hypothetical protein
MAYEYNWPPLAVTGSFPLPTGAATSANQTNGNQKTQIVDGSGNVIASTNNSLNVNLLNGSLSAGNSSTTPLGISGSFTGTSADITNYSGVNILVATDRSGILNMQFSSDGTNWDHDDAYPCTVTTGGVVQSFYFQGAPVAKYFRVKYDNGGTAQGVFRLQTIFKVNAGVADIQDLTTVPVDASNGMVTKSVIYGKSTSGGVFVAVKANPTGALFADVSGSNVYAQQNGRWDITAITGTVSLPTGASTSANQTNGSQKNQIVDGSGNVIASTSNALNVNVQNASIPVTGTFYQATQPVSAASLPLPSGAATSANQASVIGTLGAGTSATNSLLTGGVYNSSAPTLTTGQQVALQVDSSGNLKTTATFTGSIGAVNQGTANTVANAWPILMTDGTNTAAVKAASTAATTSDPSVVVALSPNSQTPKQAGLSSSNAPIYNVYSSTNITTAAYTQLIASTTSATTYIDIFDSSGQAMVLATGGAGSEVIQAYIPPGGGSLSFAIPAGTRVAYKALTANATSGYLLLNLRG